MVLVVVIRWIMDYKQIRDLYSNFIIQRTYTRFRDDLGRRETWEEAVDRYKDFLLGKINFDNSTSISTSLFEEAIEAINGEYTGQEALDYIAKVEECFNGI